MADHESDVELNELRGVTVVTPPTPTAASSRGSVSKSQIDDSLPVDRYSPQPSVSIVPEVEVLRVESGAVPRAQTRVYSVNNESSTSCSGAAKMCFESKVARFCCLVGTLGGIIFIIVILALSIRRLEVYEVGLKYNSISKELDTEPRREGLHLGEPGFEFVIYPSIFETLNWNNFKCLNEDGVNIDVDIAFQHKIIPSAIYNISLEFKDYDGYMEMVRNLADTVIHEACSNFNTDELQTNRTSFQDLMWRQMRSKLNEKISTTITDLQISDLTRPEAYTKAIRDKEAAKEGIKVAVNERPRLETQARTILLEQVNEANILINKAEADARSIRAKAEADAQAIRFEYAKEAEAYQRVKSDLSLSVEGLLSYLSSQVISRSKQPIVNLQPPAKSDYNAITGN